MRRVVVVAILAVVVMSALAACGKRRFDCAVYVRGNASVDQKLARAGAVLTAARFARLKEQLKGSFPTLTDAHLQLFGFRCGTEVDLGPKGEQTNPRAKCVLMMQEQSGVDAEAVVNEAGRIFDEELNGPKNADTAVRGAGTKQK
jgi:hypothetical protein